MSIHLKGYDFSALFIGFSFALPTLIYAATSSLIYILTAKFKKTAVIFLGYLVLSIAMFLVGPSHLLGDFFQTPVITFVGLSIMGFGCGMIIIPVLPDMIESTEERNVGMDTDELHNNISGLFIAAQGIGETLGPVLGSVFEHNYGFRTSNDIMVCTLLTFMVLYYTFCGRGSMFDKPPAKVDPVTGKAINA